MFYKSSLLALTFILLSVSSVLAADIDTIESAIAGQKLELKIDSSDRAADSPESSASIAKARLLGAMAVAPISSITGGASEAIESEPNLANSGIVQNSASVAKARLRVMATKESAANFDLSSPVVNENVSRSLAAIEGARELAKNSLEHGVADEIVVPQNLDDRSLVKEVTSTAVLPEPQSVELVRKWDLNEVVMRGDVLPRERVAQAPVVTAEEAEPKKWAVGLHTQLSTTGFVGVDAGYKFSPNLHARVGVNAVGFNVNYASQGIDYQANFNPTNFHFLGDYFPFGGGLRLTGGFVLQNNQFNATGTPANGSGQLVLGGTTYQASQVGTIESEGSFSSGVAPYLGIGFGTPLSPGLGFNMDLGVMFAGSPTVRLRANNISPLIPAGQQAQIRNDLAVQEQQTNRDIGSFNVYPVLSIGFSYAF
jgi:hypothetical protein